MTYYSDPPGATVYSNVPAQAFGYAPTTLKYKASCDFLRGAGCMTLQPTSVQWANDAEAASLL